MIRAVCDLVDTGQLLDAADLAGAALVLAGPSPGPGSEEARREALERAGQVILSCRRLSGTADGLLATGPPSDEVRAVVDTLAVSGLLDEIGQSVVRMAAAGDSAAALLVDSDVNMVDCLSDMAHQAARMTRDAVSGFLQARPGCGQDLQGPAGRIRSGHQRVCDAAAAFGPPPQRDWGLWMVEIAQELERVAELAEAIGDKAAARTGVAT